jgi:hypothetical protein
VVVDFAKQDYFLFRDRNLLPRSAVVIDLATVLEKREGLRDRVQAIPYRLKKERIAQVPLQYFGDASNAALCILL